MAALELGYCLADGSARAPRIGPLDRAEAVSLRSAGAGDRPALHEALFCVRADLVEAVKVPGWGHLGDHVTRALVSDEVSSAGKSLVVAGETVVPGRDMPVENRVVQEWVQETCAARRELMPRRIAGLREDMVFGDGRSRNELVRLAHKLHVGFCLTLSDTAEALSDAGYYWQSSRGDHELSKQIIQRRVNDEELYLYADHPPLEVDGVQRRRGGRPDPLPDLDCMAVLGLDEQGAGMAKAQDLAAQCQHTWAMYYTVDTGRQHLRSLLEIVSAISLFRTVFVTDPKVFASSAERQVTYAWLQHFGVRVLEQGVLVSRVSDEPVHERILREGTKLYAALRVHDCYTVIEATRSLDYARKTAGQLRNEKRLLREIAHHLNREAQPTSKRVGVWGVSAVKALLDGEAAR
ncbi:hypothetical protein ACIP98_37185 [Streptomyces sp. NPDC088354]|uniref:hypothetical protein n=1 Tax=Streptomyces sp. NPDC088354 TaxID=3365856 RepID=UPI00381F3B77